MKKNLTALFVFFLQGVLSALPLINPGEPTFYEVGIFDNQGCSSWSLRAGFFGDYVFNRYMEVEEQNRRSDIQTTEIFTNGGIVTLNILQTIDLYGLLAGSKIEIETPGSSFRALFSNALTEIETQSDFSWGVGSRMARRFGKGATVGIEGGYFSASLPFSFVRREDSIPEYVSGSDLCYGEWQVVLGYTQLIEFLEGGIAFAPYLCAVWSRAWMDLDDLIVPAVSNSALPDLQTQQTTGFAFGISWIFQELGSVSVGGRFVNELALAVSSQLRF